ncbi:MAG: hypothetical protein CMB80_25095 [Flammeovirgaceae bacterium]|nr:hypothetical protein [Flammeovirgaceae bacterium]
MPHVEHYCKYVTSDRRNLPPGAQLMVGDSIIEGWAVKISDEEYSQTKSSAELAKDAVAAEIFGYSEDALTSGVPAWPIGSKMHVGDFITEPGFVAGDDGAVVYHAGYGGDMRAYAPGTELKVGDLVINGSVIDPNGNTIFAPVSIDDEGHTTGADGAAVAVGGAAGDDEYCSLQELAGRPEGTTTFETFDSALELDWEIPGLDWSWWAKILEKINMINNVGQQFLAKTNGLISRMEVDPEKACALMPQVEKLLALINKMYAIMARIQKVIDRIYKIYKKILKIWKIISKFNPVAAVMEAVMMMLQIINGMEIMLKEAAKNLMNTTKLMSQLIALLQKIIAQCAVNRGADAGLSAEECEKLGGILVDRKVGDLGDYTGNMAEDDIFKMWGDVDDGGDEEDLLVDTVEGDLDAGLLDLHECLTELDDLDKIDSWT